MLKRICLLVIALSFIGCAHQTQNTIGGMHSNLKTGLSVYHQYNMVTAHLDKNQNVFHRTSVFLADHNKDLPSNIRKLSLSMAIINPYRIQVEVWERVNYIDLKTGKVYFKTEKLRYPLDNHQLLPEEFISLDLPLYSRQRCQVLFSVNVKDKSGKVVYSTYTARYKLGSKK